MSLRDKYTDEEWYELEKIALGGKYKHINFALKNEKSYEGNIPTDHIFLLDEIGQMPQLNRKVSWDFKPFEFEKKQNGNIIDSFNKFNNIANEIIKEKIFSRGIIESMIEIVNENRVSGITPKVAIMSINDYTLFSKQVDELNFIVGKISSINFTVKEILLCGCKIKVHTSENAEDGKIEIY